MYCPECDHQFSEEENKEFSLVCPDCKTELQYCEVCESFVREFDFDYILDVCEMCDQIYFSECEQCGERFHEGNLYDNLCEDCQD